MTPQHIEIVSGGLNPRVDGLFSSSFFSRGRALGFPSCEKKDQNGGLVATKRRFEKCSHKAGP